MIAGGNTYCRSEDPRTSAPISDKATIFWNSYKKLADEYDTEFKEKHSTDLDTYLIFVRNILFLCRCSGKPIFPYQAGLFSAVSSAFIIQIQPELQPDSTATDQALIRLLIHTVNSSIFSRPDIIIPEPTGPSTVIVAVEGLLYISLFFSLLAALLVVLAKQWLMYYRASGERARGTMEQRCLERRRKMDGMHQWKLEAVLNIYPLLLQVSLLLFTAALTINLWETRHSIAGLVLAIGALGVLSYAFAVITALISPDAPFQTP
ncbi:hypothetical protein FB451DRAFT_1435414, partial [Mycena latifolia]